MGERPEVTYQHVKGGGFRCGCGCGMDVDALVAERDRAERERDEAMRDLHTGENAHTHDGMKALNEALATAQARITELEALVRDVPGPGDHNQRNWNAWYDRRRTLEGDSP